MRRPCTVGEADTPPARSADPEADCGEAVGGVDERAGPAPLRPGGDLDETLCRVTGTEDPGNGH